MKKIFCVAILIFSMHCLVRAQALISSAGTTGTIPGYTLSWSVGEPVVFTATAPTAILTQGFHQSKLVITSTQELLNNLSKILVFPNPFQESFSVQNDGNFTWLEYSITNIEGKTLRNGHFTDQLQSFDMKGYASGVYFLTVKNARNNQFQTFKILKQ